MISILIPYLPDQGPRDELFEIVLRYWGEVLPAAEIVVGTNMEEPFNRGAARNDAFKNSSGDTLIIADADTLIPRDQIYDALHLIISGEAPWSIPYTVYYNLLEEETKEITEDFSIYIKEPTRWEHRLLESVAGILVLPRAAYVEVNGYDERFRGWGGEDRAFDFALDALWGKKVRLEGFIEHLWHPRGDADFSQPFWNHNAALLRTYQGAFVNPVLMSRLVADHEN